MKSEELYKQYYVEFGEFPPLMMTTDGESEEYLKEIEKAIKSGNRLTEEQINHAYQEPYDLVTKIKLKEQKKNDN